MGGEGLTNYLFQITIIIIVIIIIIITINKKR